MAALLHLTNDLWEEFAAPNSGSGSSFIVDKILMDYKSFQQCKSVVVHDIRDEFEMNIGILVVKDDDQLLLEIDQDGTLQPFGKWIMVRDGQGNDDSTTTTTTSFRTRIENVDPLSVLDDVSKKQWVLLDIQQQEDDDVNNGVGTGAIFNLLELVSNSIQFGAGSWDLLGGNTRNIIGDNSATDKDVLPLDGHGVGGVGMTCSSPSSLMEMAAIIQSLSPGSKGYRTTESGIFVQQSLEGTSSSSSECSTGSSRGSSSRGIMDDENNPLTVNYAIVMPFDASLWKAASFLLGTCTEF